MPDIQTLVSDNLSIWTTAIKKKSSAGRGTNKKINLYGIKKLRELILELAVRGKLVPPDPNEEPASILLDKIVAEKEHLVKVGKIKKQKSLPPIGDDEKLFELPKGWEWIRLGNITEINPRNIAEDELNVSFVPMPSITTNYKGEHGQEIRKWGEIKKGYTHFSNGDIALAKITPCFENSKAAVFKGLKNGLGAGTTELHVARPFGETIDRLYILLYLKSPQFLLIGETKMTGTAGQKRVPKDFFAGNPLPLPSLAEQKRIVAKVDELMALCGQLEQQTEHSITAHQTLVETLLAGLTENKNAEEFAQSWRRISGHFDTLFTTEQSIDRLKQTILQLAVMGKLVPQDPDDESASILLEKIAAEKAQLVKEGKLKKQKPLPPIGEKEKMFEVLQGWEWVKFDHIAENSKNALKAGPFGSALKKSMYVEKGFKIYGQEQVISGDENHGDYYVDKEKFNSLESCAIKPGDILISLVGTIGKVLVLSKQCQPGIINPRLVKLGLYAEVFRPYIQVMLASPLIQEEFDVKSHGGTMNILNLGLLRNLSFPLPPKAEQHRIVAKVYELMALCDQLKARLKDAQTSQTHLADAIVEKAITA